MILDRTEDITEQHQHVRAYIDRLPGDQLTAVRGLLETMFSPLDRKLALAPIDDEPVTAEDLAAIQAGAASLEGGGVPMEPEVKSVARFLETEAGDVNSPHYRFRIGA